MKKIILTGGGTGGHVIPNISLLPFLEKEFDEIHYIGGNGIEKEILSKYPKIIYHEIPVYKYNRINKVKNISLPFKILGSVSKSIKVIKQIKPSVIFSKGGYVAVPVCLAGYIKRIPIIGHESDLTLGKANKIIYKLSKSFCTTFEKTSLNLKKAVYTGSPIRQELFKGNKKNGYKITNFPTRNKPTILITGGSTGARDLNNIVFKAIPKLEQKFNIIHLVGKNKAVKTNFTASYCQIEYCHKIEDLFAISDIIISRAGSGAIFEILALNKPMILIPLPKGNSRGDQEENAEYFSQKKYATIIKQKDLTPDILIKKINEIYNKNIHNQGLYNLKFAKGSENIFQEILKVIKKDTE